MKKLFIVAVAVASTLIIAGCAENKPISFDTDLRIPVTKVTLEDGRILECIYLSQASGSDSTGGPSCDWENAK